MSNKVESKKAINLIGEFEVVKKKSTEFKGEYTRFFPSKLSSTNFLTLFSLYIMKAKDAPVYGKEILNDVTKILGNSISAWNPSHGTLYPLLDKMLKEDLIEETGQVGSIKYYVITEKGTKYLSEQLKTFKPMLFSSRQFFDNVISRMYKQQ